MDSSIDYLGIDKRTCRKKFGKQEAKRRVVRKGRARIVRKLEVFERPYLRACTEKLIWIDLVPGFGGIRVLEYAQPNDQGSKDKLLRCSARKSERLWTHSLDSRIQSLKMS